MFKGEKIFNSERPVKYLYKQSYKKTNSLIIIFSAFSPIGKPPVYNFVSTLDEFDCNKLFILDDFGARATYYLCENRNFSIERSVIELIQTIIKKNDIEKVITCGSSKGGYAALYFGIKYGFDHIIAGSPQYLLGQYLLEQTNSQAVSEFMSGASDDDDLHFLNDILSQEILKSTNKPNVFIHVGKGEYHYQVHVKPLLKKLDEKHIPYTLDLGDYTKHSDVALHFPQVLKDQARNILGFPFVTLEQTLEGNQPINSKGIFIVQSESLVNLMKWNLYLDGKLVRKTRYSLSKKFKTDFERKGKYQLRVTVINRKGIRVRLKSKFIIVT